MSLKILPIPCLSDNYAYLLTCQQTHQVAVVDPSEASPVLDALKGRTLHAIWNTHHHWDHVGGNDELVQTFPHVNVYGFHTDEGRIPRQNVFLKDGERFQFGTWQVEISHNPGHTSGALTYYIDNNAFTGDTLFSIGCGRVFEGTYEQMYKSLNHVIGVREDSMKIYAGHEYTQKNLEFARWLEPENQDVIQALASLRLPCSMPSTLGYEKRVNPFLRVQCPKLRQAVAAHVQQYPKNNLETFALIRKLKDSF